MKTVRRIFGAANIKRHLQRKKPDHAKGAETSSAGQAHAEGRAAARRRRQIERAR